MADEGELMATKVHARLSIAGCEGKHSATCSVVGPDIRTREEKINLRRCE